MQGTLEWKQLRAGKVTASRVADVVDKSKSGYTMRRDHYMTDLALERIGVDAEVFTNAAMQWGTETEPLARIEYETVNLVSVDQVDFVDHPEIDFSGCSPDGLVGDGLLEIKCPKTTTHLRYVLADVVPEAYKAQMSWQMACTKAPWCDFVSYDPRAPEGLNYLQIRYYRDQEYIDMLEKEVIKFLGEVEVLYQKLKDKLNGKTLQSKTSAQTTEEK